MKYNVLSGLFILLAAFRSTTSDRSIRSTVPSREMPVQRSLVDSFYALNKGKVFWFSRDQSSTELRNCLLNALDSAFTAGLNSEDYDTKGLRQDMPALDSPGPD